MRAAPGAEARICLAGRLIGDTRGASRTGPVRPAPVDVGGPQGLQAGGNEASPVRRCHGTPVPSLGVGCVIVTALTPAGRRVPGSTPRGVLQSQHAREGVAADDFPSPRGRGSRPISFHSDPSTTQEQAAGSARCSLLNRQTLPSDPFRGPSGLGIACWLGQRDCSSTTDTSSTIGCVSRAG